MNPFVQDDPAAGFRALGELRAELGVADGSNTVVDERGRFIDPAVVANAEVVLALADALSAKKNR